MRLIDPPYGYVAPLQFAVIADAMGRDSDAALELAGARRENAWALLWEDVDPRLKRLRAKYH